MKKLRDLRSKDYHSMLLLRKAAVEQTVGHNCLGFYCLKMIKTPTKRSQSGDAKSSAKKAKPSVGPSILVKDWFEESRSKMFVGAHVSITGSIENAVREAASIGGQAFAMFLCNQRQWAVKPLEDKDAEDFRSACQELGYPSHLILPHSSYLMNCGSHDAELLSKTRALFLDGVQRCDKLGISLYNFHPGSTCNKIPINTCLKNIAESINYVHGNTNQCITGKPEGFTRK